MQNNEALKFKPVALPCGQKGSTRLYTTNLFVGGCPHECIYCYAQGFRAFSKSGPRPVSLQSITGVKKFPARIFLSSASDPLHPIVVELTAKLLQNAQQAGSFVVISTKALATPEIVRILSRHSDQVSYTVSLTSLNSDRNRILEPNAPSAYERLYGNNYLCGIEQIADSGLHITLKMDTLFPALDDTQENIEGLLRAARSSGAQAVMMSYGFLRKSFKKRLIGVPLLRDSLIDMNEYQPIASGKGYSLPLYEKKVRLSYMAQIAKDIGYQVISTCSCKNRIQSLSEGIPLRLDCHFHERWF